VVTIIAIGDCATTGGRWAKSPHLWEFVNPMNSSIQQIRNGFTRSLLEGLNSMMAKPTSKAIVLRNSRVARVCVPILN
jgi:hypothetical protein